MARKTKPLTDTEIKAAKPKDADYQLYDGDGLIQLDYLTKLDRQIYEEGERNFGGSHK